MPSLPQNTHITFSMSQWIYRRVNEENLRAWHWKKALKPYILGIKWPYHLWTHSICSYLHIGPTQKWKHQHQPRIKGRLRKPHCSHKAMSSWWLLEDAFNDMALEFSCFIGWISISSVWEAPIKLIRTPTKTERYKRGGIIVRRSKLCRQGSGINVLYVHIKCQRINKNY